MVFICRIAVLLLVWIYLLVHFCICNIGLVRLSSALLVYCMYQLLILGQCVILDWFRGYRIRIFIFHCWCLLVSYSSHELVRLFLSRPTNILCLCEAGWWSMIFCSSLLGVTYLVDAVSMFLHLVVVLRSVRIPSMRICIWILQMLSAIRFRRLSGY